MKKCRKCNVDLVVGVNWHKSQLNNRNYICKICQNNYTTKWRKRNPEYQSNWLKKHINYVVTWFRNNPKRAVENARRWQKKNPKKCNAIYAKRRAAKLQRTPAWADLKAISKFYENCPKGYHVDHIIPLQGKNVSGLHVLDNLQYLTAKENQKKGNKY